MTEQEQLTADAIAAKLDINKSTFYTAVNDLGIEPERPIRGDRRIWVYPPGTTERVTQWIIDHRK